jgi:hypothetical protein
VNLRGIAAQIPDSEPHVFPGAHEFLFQSRTAFTPTVDGFLVP